MKVYSVLLIIVFSLTTNIFSQVEFTPHTITILANDARSVYAVDVDGDGDMDVLSASFVDDKIAWYENDGNENFTTHTITTDANGARSVYAIDVDGDGDMDVLSASRNDNKIAWYENLSPVGIEAISNEIPIEFSLSQNYPNPFNPVTAIRFAIPQSSYVSLEVFNALGEKVEVLVFEELSAGTYKYEWNAEDLTSGIYFYRLTTGSFSESKKMILLK
ncbi:MAG: T9SS type A sorting domain-containing protein [Bacteroidetes bacterium]|nr:T9SS type A sorting domain-containing protein [Bacteroidota bacterium]